MKRNNLIIPIFAVLLSVLFFSCDDSGVNPSNVPKGLITFNQNNLKRLEGNIDGVYELWLRLDSSGIKTDYSLGKFNIGSSGEITNTSGAPMQFRFQGDTNKLYQSSQCFVTVEPPYDIDAGPSVAVLISGQTATNKDSIFASLTIGGSLALGSAGQELLKGTNAGFTISAPTAGVAYCWQGVWFCDVNGNTLFPSNIQLSTAGWYYQGWVVDYTVPNNPVYYKTGRFSNPYGPDFDGAGPCAGTLPPYQKPGEDWVLTNCPNGRPNISEATKLNYGVFVTLEPSYEQSGSQAFQDPFLKVFEVTSIPGWIHCGTLMYLYNMHNNFPKAQIKITN